MEKIGNSDPLGRGSRALFRRPSSCRPPLPHPGIEWEAYQRSFNPTGSSLKSTQNSILSAEEGLNGGL